MLGYRIKEIVIENFLKEKKKIVIEFDLKTNILIGANGCGKTTILKMISSLSTKNLDYFKDIPFTRFSLKLENGKEYFIEKEKTKVNYLFKENLSSKKKLLMTSENKSRDLYFDRSINLYEKYEKYEELKIMLGREYNSRYDVKQERKKEEIKVDFIPLTRTYHFFDEKDYEYLNINELFAQLKEEHMQAISFYSKENEKFKDKILILPFSDGAKMGTFISNLYAIINFTDEEAHKIIDTYQELVDKKEILKIEEQLLKIKEIRMEILKKDGELENVTEQELLERVIEDKLSQDMYILLMDSPRIEMINSIGKLAAELLTKKEKIFEKFRKIESVLNLFFKESNKTIAISRNGELKILENNRSLDTKYLSSGEKQLITLFTHIILKTYKEGNKIFMIDEPEVSLHLYWQEKFMDALNKIGENQYILATHSPEIIGKYMSKVKVINSGGVFKDAN